MTFGARRRIIPLSASNLELWPGPDEYVLLDKVLQRYRPRQQAVRLYAAGCPFVEIKGQTGIGEDEVQRLVKRCVTPHADGEIYGFRALLPGTRLKDYKRSRPVEHIKGGGSGACAGALEQLFDRFPEVRAMVHQSFLDENSKDVLPEARMPMTALHRKFKRVLRKLGFTEFDWPFNTENCAYKALCTYCKDLQLADAQRAALSRCGEDAARRGAIGKGQKALLPDVRLFSFAQLDFHKVDAASIIVLRNDFGVELEVPISRWHIGLLVEEHGALVLGCFVALERTPSSDSTLEILDSALRPDENNEDDGSTLMQLNGDKVLLRQLMPEFNYQCFAGLKVDNAWSNAAHEVVNNAMDTIGCAINFGPVRAWWRRHLVERIFEKLTQRGLQRLPSTHGKGPGDPRSRDPNAKAIKFRIMLTDLISVIFACIREHNTEGNEGLQWASPLQTAQAALSHPASGLILQPLPMLTQKSLWLTMHIEESTVRANLDRNEKPYFVVDRCRYSNSKLACSPWLIGKTLIVYVDRRRCRIVYATVKETGERLGLMLPPAKWANSNCSWRDRKLFNRSGMAARNATETEDPVEVMKRDKAGTLQKRARSKRNHSSKDGLDLARLAMSNKGTTGYVREAVAVPQTPAQQPTPPSSQTPARPDPFGLASLPQIGTVRRRN
jgi:hypothetical protein